jgi:hypothetical protein
MILIRLKLLHFRINRIEFLSIEKEIYFIKATLIYNYELLFSMEK